MRGNIKKWRESASVIVVAKTAFSPNVPNCNFKVLTLRRSQRSGFMPGTYVFPGGNIDKSDSSPDWLKLYERFGFKIDAFNKLNPQVNRPNIFTNFDEHKEIPKYISLRITAIRETFEECGILICRSFKINYKERLARWASFIEGPETQKWQKMVQHDPLKFYDLCSNFEVYPDIWSLKEWSNWVTPYSVPGGYDAAFFLATLQQMPPTFPCEKEVQELMWATPSEYIAACNREETPLPPPQFYEVSRLRNFSDISNLLRFATERANYGLERYLPYRINTDSGVYSILPGDSLYADIADPTKEAVPYMKDIPNSKVQNRIKHTTSIYLHQLLIKNLKPDCNHIAPFNCKL